MLATVQGNVATSVLNVTLRPDVDTATIRLSRAANVAVHVGWFTVLSAVLIASPSAASAAPGAG